VDKWYLPTLSEIISLSEPTQGTQVEFSAQQRLRAEREWCGAIAALNDVLKNLPSVESTSTAVIDSAIKGVVLSGPLPVLVDTNLVNCFSTWAFTSDPLSMAFWMSPFQLLPASEQETPVTQLQMSTLPLLPQDPLAAEQFCLVLTAQFGVVMALGETTDHKPAFLFSFTPDVVWQAWQSLRSRLSLTSPQFLSKLDALADQFAPVAPHYQTVLQFSRLLLAHLPEPSDWEEPPSEGHEGFAHTTDSIAKEVIDLPRLSVDKSVPSNSHVKSSKSKTRNRVGFAAADQTFLEPQRSLDKFTQAKASSDAELLQAIAHEVRTPLTTIRTLTRLLLKRKDLNPDVLKRLEMIDRECTEQIDRFNLIFRAVELETTPTKHPLSPLSAISLADIFQQNISRWQDQARQRGLNLEVLLPQKLPMVVADPTMLNQMLTGLIDRITHSLPPGSHIQIHVQLAGHQLKLQFRSETGSFGVNPEQPGSKPSKGFVPTLKSLGQLLMFQPETGNLSLNLSVTKNLFQALGGKLIVRQHPYQGEVLTVFLPLEQW
jgi:signal transduction histidine kinase